jgi:acetyltransferase-like isoleucine patch superfamily enzyme
VWIGYNVIILPSCKKIGNGVVIGAGAVVTHDIEPYSVVGGNPARMIRKRFDDDMIRKIEQSKWWENEPKDLSKIFDELENL